MKNSDRNYSLGVTQPLMQNSDRNSSRRFQTNQIHLVQVVVAELRGHEEEPRLQDVHGRGDRDGVEVLELDLGDHVAVRLQGDLEDVPLFGLDQEEEHGLGLVGGGADEDHAAVGVVEVVPPARDGAPDVRLIAEVFERDVVFRANQDACNDHFMT